MASLSASGGVDREATAERRWTRTRDADVGASPGPGPWPRAAQRWHAGPHPGPPAGRPPAAHRSRRTARRPTGRSQPTTDRRIHVLGSAGVGDDGDTAPQQHSGPNCRPADGWPDAVVTPRRPGSDCTASLDLSIGPHDVPWRAYHGTGYFGHSRLAKCLAWESAKRYSPQITMTSAMIPRPAIRAAMIPDVSL